MSLGGVAAMPPRLCLHYYIGHFWDAQRDLESKDIHILISTRFKDLVIQQ